MLDVNSAYIANIVVMLLIAVLGVVGGFFLARGQVASAKAQAQIAKNAGQDKVIIIQEDLISGFERKISQIKEEHGTEIAQMKEEHNGQITNLQAQITELRVENERLRATVDNLVIVEESRTRVRTLPRKPAPKESEN